VQQNEQPLRITQNGKPEGVLLTHREYDKFAFHKKGAGLAWEEIDSQLQAVLIARLRMSGINFFVPGALLTTLPISCYLVNDSFVKYSILIIAVLASFGIFLLNYNLYKETKANTPGRDPSWRWSRF
jgi:hypothetical protein